MMKYIYYIFMLISAAAFTACDAEQSGKLADWGEAVYYSDFWWNRYEPENHRMEQTLELEFNDDARRHFTGEVVLELMAQDGEKIVAVENLKLFKNDVACEQNRLRLTLADSVVKVSVEFCKDSPGTTETYKLFLVPVDKGGLDKIEQIELENGFMVSKVARMNPLAKKTMWIAIVAAALLTTWIVVSRMVNPSLKFSRITFDYNDGGGEQSRRVGGCYKIVCTNQSKRVSLLHRIFVGKVYFETNEFWKDELTIMCGSRDSIRLITRGDYRLPDDPVRKEAFTVDNCAQSSVNIETT